MIRSVIFIIPILIIMLVSCSNGPTENPDGKYGQAVDKTIIMPINEIITKQGQYVKKDLVINGTITKIDNSLETWFVVQSGKDSLKCTIADFKLPESLVGKTVYVSGMLEMVEVSTEKGRQPGGEYTFAADPSSEKFNDELRIRVKGIEVSKDQPAK